MYWRSSIKLAKRSRTGTIRRPWIGLFQGAKCNNVTKCNLEYACGKSVVVAVTPFLRLIAMQWYEEEMGFC